MLKKAYLKALYKLGESGSSLEQVQLEKPSALVNNDKRSAIFSVGEIPDCRFFIFRSQLLLLGFEMAKLLRFRP